MPDIRVKICGLRTAADVVAVAQAGAAYMGLVFFAKSPRYVTLPQARDLALADVTDVGIGNARRQDAVVGTEPGLEPWQFYGPSTRRGNTTYLHLLMRPYETVTVRGLPIKKVKGVRVFSSGQELTFSARCAILDQWFNPNPLGEVTIDVPEEVIDSFATVLALEMEE